MLIKPSREQIRVDPAGPYRKNLKKDVPVASFAVGNRVQFLKFVCQLDDRILVKEAVVDLFLFFTALGTMKTVKKAEPAPTDPIIKFQHFLTNFKTLCVSILMHLLVCLF